MIILSKVKTPMPELPLELRKTSFEEAATGYTEEMAIREAMRCLNCRKHPCMTKGCPVHNNIPGFLEKVAHGEFEEAYQILCETTSLPAVCGRVCPQYLQCEGNCVRGTKGQPVSIGALERFVADLHRKNAKEQPAAAQANGKKVAVIGSGPAGIACAGDLAAKGYAVTVFEKADVVGGVLTYGIPSFRLPKDIVESEINGLKAKGVEILTGKAAGKDLTAADLMKQGYNAVFYGNGAGIPYHMGIPGEDAGNVCTADEYLNRINCENACDPESANPLPKAKKIAIVGGGNVAMDACRCAARTGAEKVYVVYRRSQAEMPADPAEVREAEEEGVEFMYLTNPTEVIADENGSVRALQCIRMELGEPDASGRRRPVPIEGSEFILETDYVVMAIGTGFDPDVKDSAADAEFNRKGAFVVDEETQAASVPGIFAGGDNVTGPNTVIAAMGAGKRAAAAIDAYLA